MKFLSVDRRLLLCLALTLPAAPAVSQGSWVPLDRITTPELFKDVATDGDHLVASFSSSGRPDAVVYRKEEGAWETEEVLTKTSGLFRWGPCAIRDGWLVLSLQRSGGSADLFEKTPSGWELRQTLSDPTPGGSFGRDVAFGDDVLVVGDPMLADGSASDVHLYVLDAGVWTLAQTIDGPAAANGDDAFGLSVDIEGSRLFVGAPAWGARGTVFVYERTNGPFVEVDRLVGGASDRDFGRSLDAYGSDLLIGAQGLSNIPGSASFFAFDGSAWTLERRFADPEGDSDSQFGRKVVLGPGVAAVGAPWGLGQNDSKVYFLHRIAGRWMRTGSEVDPPPIPFGRFGIAMAFDRQQLTVTSNAGIQGGEIHVYGPTFVTAPPLGPQPTGPSQ